MLSCKLQSLVHAVACNKCTECEPSQLGGRENKVAESDATEEVTKCFLHRHGDTPNLTEMFGVKTHFRGELSEIRITSLASTQVGEPFRTSCRSPVSTDLCSSQGVRNNIFWTFLWTKFHLELLHFLTYFIFFPHKFMLLLHRKLLPTCCEIILKMLICHHSKLL